MPPSGPVTGQPRYPPSGTPFQAHPEFNNSSQKPAGPQQQLNLSEGIYVQKDEILLGIIPHHPSFVPPATINVLDTKQTLPTAGPRLSIAIVAPKKLPSPRPTTESSVKSSVPGSIIESQQDSSQSGSEKGERNEKPIANAGFGLGSLRVRFGGDTQLAAQNKEAKEAKEALKRRKPKQSLSKSSSTFLSRVVIHENLAKRIQEHAPDGIYAIVNTNRALLWMDLSSEKMTENLTKIMFTKAHPLCHDFNVITRTAVHLDICVGFSTADILWYEPISQKYTRINKNGLIHNSPVVEIKWLPDSENTFVAAHLDGSIIFYDKEKEDVSFISSTAGVQLVKVSDKKTIPGMIVKKSFSPGPQKMNPLGVWKLGAQRIRGMEFSPNGCTLAIVSEDGTLRVIDLQLERLLDVFPSYYGGMTCVCWSPDGLYLLTGSQDDLISIWSLTERALVARCLGHKSWITCVAFDLWRCDDRTYRFGSVAEDGRLLLWDFSVGLLPKPRAASTRQSISSIALRGAERNASVATVLPASLETVPANETQAPDYGILTAHAVLPRSFVPMLPPVLSKIVDEHPLCWLGFEADRIVTSCKRGHIRTWERPTLPHEAGSHPKTTPNFSDPFKA